MRQIVVFSLIAVLVLFMVLLFTTRGHAQPIGQSAGVASTGEFLKAVNAPVGAQDKELRGNQYPAFEKKFSEGLVNVVSSWTEIPQKVVSVSRQDNIFSGITLGLGKGVVSGAERAAIGGIEIATSPISPNQSSMLKARYKVAKPEEEGWKIDILKW